MKKIFLILLLLPLFVNGQINKIKAKYPIDDPKTENLNDGILGKWKFEEDTNKDNYYKIVRGNGYPEDKYHIFFWNRGGKNPTYESSNLSFSKIGNTTFINVPHFEEGMSDFGYFFLKIIAVNDDFTKITAAVVGDTNLWNLDKEGVKKEIAKNMDKPSYYSKTVHLYKVREVVR